MLVRGGNPSPKVKHAGGVTDTESQGKTRHANLNCHLQLPEIKESLDLLHLLMTTFYLTYSKEKTTK